MRTIHFPLKLRMFPADTSYRANVKVTHGMALKQCNNVINMNTALIYDFLDLVPVTFKLYELIWMKNPTSFFCKMFTWFVTKCGRTSADNCKSNSHCTAMALE